MTSTASTTTTTTTSPGRMEPDHSILTIVVIGASGDLAKKKTYPSLFHLYCDRWIPHTSTTLQIYGYARSVMSDVDLRQRLRPYLLQQLSQSHMKHVTIDQVDDFLQHCYYQAGTSYGDHTAYTEMIQRIQTFERQPSAAAAAAAEKVKVQQNRLFYFAIPPSAFAETGIVIRQTSMQDPQLGWTRLIVEKPFGRDLQSFETLNQTLSQHFAEDHIYRIDHYLGKELVQNLTVMRFSNIWLEKIWNNECIQSIILTFKEPFGTDGRGGYFDSYGIIRDILQNHLLQVLALLCMETPTAVTGPLSGKAIRDAKVAVLNAITPIALKDVVLGQYEGYAGTCVVCDRLFVVCFSLSLSVVITAPFRNDHSHKHSPFRYIPLFFNMINTDDPTITNKDTNTPTFAVIKLQIHTPRWHNVPIILKAGKALNERKAEIRIQFKDAPAAEFLFQGTKCPRNELVMRMQPNEAVYLKTNVKSPGFHAVPIQSELEVNYDTRYFDRENTESSNPEAYTRLILDVYHGKHASFVRDDELRRAWEIFTPVLHEIESPSYHVKPIVYQQGSRGPKEADDFIEQHAGYVRNLDYQF